MNNNSENENKSTQNWLARAHESLNDARLLYEKDRHYGSVVNRAYYAMLYAVFALLVPYHVEKGPDLDGDNITFFEDKFVASNIISQNIGKKIRDAYELCQAYDFQPPFTISKEHAVETLNSSDEFINAIEQKLKEQP